MKKILLLTALISSSIAFFAFKNDKHTPIFDASLIANKSDSFPNNASISNASTMYNVGGGLRAKVGSVFTNYIDTASANATNLYQYSGAAIWVNDTLYIRSISGTKWISVFGNGGIIPFNDSIYVKPPLYVIVDSLGRRIIAIHMQDGLVSGGIVTWSGQGLIFNISPAIYVIGGVQYSSPATRDTLSPANGSNPRYDLFVVDTSNRAGHITGEAAPSPTVPQPEIGFQLSLTNGLIINPGDTIPSNILNKVIYDETAISPEWAINHNGYLIMDSLNTDNPYHLAHDIFISKYSSIAGINPVIKWQHATTDTFHSGDVLQFALYLNGKLGSTKVYFDLLKSGGYATKYIFLENGYINPNDTNHYVLVTIPLDNLTWVGNGTFDAMRIGFLGTDTSGAKGMYIDRIWLQSGIPNIQPSGNFQDSNSVKNDSLFQWHKGISSYLGKVNGGGSGGNSDSTLQQAFDKSILAGDNPTINAHGNNVTIDSSGYFSVTARNGNDQSNLTIQSGDNNILSQNNNTSQGVVYSSLLHDNPDSALAGISATTNSLTTQIDVYPTYAKIWNSTSFNEHLKLVIANLDTLLSPPTYIASFDGDTLKKVAYPTSSGSGGINIYNTDSSLAGDRTVDLNGHELIFTDLSGLLVDISPTDDAIALGTVGGSSLLLNNNASVYSANTHTFNGQVNIGGVNYPTSDGGANQVLTSHGNNTATWEDASGGVSISQGYGIVATPNPITSTGTIVVDSAALSLKYLRIADTSSMLAPYPRRKELQDTAAAIRAAFPTAGQPVITKSPLVTISHIFPDVYDSIGILQSGTSSNGYLSSADWNRFNSTTDTSFRVITANNLGATPSSIYPFSTYKGLYLVNNQVPSTSSSVQSSPPVYFKSIATTAGNVAVPVWLRMSYTANSNGLSGTLNLASSIDSSIWTGGLTLSPYAGIGASSGTFSSSVSSPNITVSGMAIINSGTRIIFGTSSKNPNPFALVENADTTKGFLINRGSTLARLKLGTAPYRFNITFAGTSGYTSGAVTLSGGSGTGGFSAATITASGGLVTSLGTAGSYNYKYGDVLTISKSGSSNDATATITKLQGDTACGLQFYDTTLNRLFIWNCTNHWWEPIGPNPHAIFTPTTGGTVTTTVYTDEIINPSGTLAALTIALPSSPVNNDKVYLNFTQAITAITYSGGTVVGKPTAATAGQQWYLTYDITDNKWY